MHSRGPSLTLITMSVTQEQLRAIIFYEWLGGIGATATTLKINSRSDKGTATIRTIKRWFARFASGNTDFEDKPRSEPPPTLLKTPPFSTLSKRIRRYSQSCDKNRA
ncbi:hypothetical protein RB195_011962 [Necator americanus]|uniref:Mos1 transposase HTH domain-containing protein n=1 Tax=Necator americanus TaxID=51031 RepID=A0ABR1D511_NECAM